MVYRQKTVSFQHGESHQGLSVEPASRQRSRLVSTELEVGKVGGRLSLFINKWKNFTDSKFILNAIKGYKIQFDKPVFQLSTPKEPIRSETEITQFKLEIQTLISKNVVKKCEPCEGQFISSIFLVPKPDGKFRFILNLKKLNQFMSVDHFLMENYKTVINLLSKDAFMASIDLEDAFLTVPIHPTSRKYLRFIFQGVLYEFWTLPFGLCKSPWLFSKILRPPVAYLRKSGILLVDYLDDFLILDVSYEKCETNVKVVLDLLRELGFLVSLKKSSLIPQKICKYLGFIFNSEDDNGNHPRKERFNLQPYINFVKERILYN